MPAALSQPETSTLSPNELAESDFEEPTTVGKLAFIELFTQRLRDRAPVAALLTPKVSFVDLVENECAAVTKAYIEQMPASDIDTACSFEATYAWENPDCNAPPDSDMMLEFNLEEVLSGWSRIEAVAEDQGFNAFSLLNRARDGIAPPFSRCF